MNWYKQNNMQESVLLELENCMLTTKIHRTEPIKAITRPVFKKHNKSQRINKKEKIKVE